MPRELLYRNDIQFVERARSLADSDWARQSLCSEWTNHDVLAHLLVGYRCAPTTVVAAVVAHRGSFDRANAHLACDLAKRRSPAALIDEFAQLIVQPRGIGRVFPRRLLLGDHVIHQLDISLALGDASWIEPAQLAAVLNTQVRVPNPFVPAAARARNLCLQATDIDWTHGDGPRVTGTAPQLASVLAGRPKALAQLRGDGVGKLASRL